MKTTILVIPAEGDSPETEQWYVKSLKEHYGDTLSVLVFEPSQNLHVAEGIQESIDCFLRQYHQAILRSAAKLEIHAQAGLGCFTAFAMLNHPLGEFCVHRVFFIGGAPANAMTKAAFFFHRYLSWLWYYSPIPFFADDPDPARFLKFDSARIASEAKAIRSSSTACMRRNPKLFRNQLIHLSKWKLPEDYYHWATDPKCHFIPNGVSYRSNFRDQTYCNNLASKIWLDHGVESTNTPSDYFSMYNLLPAEALFQVMDHVRQLT